VPGTNIADLPAAEDAPQRTSPYPACAPELGSSYPLGATVSRAGVNFNLYSRDASRLADSRPSRITRKSDRPRVSDRTMVGTDHRSALRVSEPMASLRRHGKKPLVGETQILGHSARI
jgi:hypothetical protein